MQTQKESIFLWLTGATLALIALAPSASFAHTMVTLEQPVHFTNAEGSDVVLQAGEYAVEPAEEWLQITPSQGQAVDAMLLEAQIGNHEESLTTPLAVSAEGEQADTYHLALLLPDGKRQEAIGSYSGVRSRAAISSLTLQRIRALAAAKQSSSNRSPEFVTPTFGGSGGNQSYNLDCGPGAVMVGILGKTGSWIDAIGVICQQVNPDGQLGAEFTTRTVGGTGGATKSDRCPSGSVVGSFSARTGSFVERTFMKCLGWDQPNKRPIPLGSNHTLTVGNTVEIGPGYTGNLLNLPNQGFDCPLPKVGKALRGRYGVYIDSIRFVCDDWDQ
ncbi:MAG: hypothetical protein AB7T38_06450 [Nitrospirales bacterium]